MRALSTPRTVAALASSTRWPFRVVVCDLFIHLRLENLMVNLVVIQFSVIGPWYLVIDYFIVSRETGWVRPVASRRRYPRSKWKELERELLRQKTTRQRRRTTKTVAQKHMIPWGLRWGEARRRGARGGVPRRAGMRSGERRGRRRRRRARGHTQATQPQPSLTLRVNKPILISAGCAVAASDAALAIPRNVLSEELLCFIAN